MTTVSAEPVETPRPSLSLVPPSAPCWFIGPLDHVPVKVGGADLMLARDISARVAFALTQGLESDQRGWQEYTLRKAAAFLRGWSLPTSLPDTYEGRLDVLRTMRRGRFEQLYEAIVEHDASHERRYHKGKPVSEAEWAAATKAHTDAGKAGTLPTWDALLPYLEPTASDVSADAWFVSADDGVTLQLPEGQWMRIKVELTQGEHVRLVTPPKAGDAELVPAAWVGAKRLGMYLVDWSLQYPDGRKVPPVLESVAELDARRFASLHLTLDAYERLLKTEREANPTGAQ